MKIDHLSDAGYVLEYIQQCKRVLKIYGTLSEPDAERLLTSYSLGTIFRALSKIETATSLDKNVQLERLISQLCHFDIHPDTMKSNADKRTFGLLKKFFEGFNYTLLRRQKQNLVDLQSRSTSFPKDIFRRKDDIALDGAICTLDALQDAAADILYDNKTVFGKTFGEIGRRKQSVKTFNKGKA